MTSIVGPAIDTEVEYRRERITKDFRGAQTQRKVRTARSGRTVKPRFRARTA